MSLFDIVPDRGEGRGGELVGVAIGIVTNNQDPDGLGRVKIKFPWRGDSDESHWARVATLMAGAQMGTYFLPEVDDEVLVAFEQGNVDHPFVLGSLWNGQEKPPEQNSDGKNNLRKLKSRSGHEITLNDEDGKEQLVIKSKGGHVITLDDTAGGEKIEVLDKNGDGIKLDSAQKNLAINCSMQLKIKANEIEIESDSSMTIKAGATLTLKGATVQIN